MISVLNIFYFSLLVLPLYLLITNYVVDKKSVHKEMVILFLVFTFNNIAYVSGNYSSVFTYGFFDILVLDLLTMFVANGYSIDLKRRKLVFMYGLKTIFLISIYIFKDYFGSVVNNPTYLLFNSLYIITAIMNIIILFKYVVNTKIKISFSVYIVIQTFSSFMMQSSLVSLYKILNIFAFTSLVIFLVLLFLENRIVKDNTINKLSSRLDIVNVFLKILAVSNENSVITNSNFSKIFHRISENILAIICKDFGWQAGALYVFEKSTLKKEKVFGCKGDVNFFIPMSIANDVSISMMKAEARKVELYKKEFTANESIFKHIFEVSQIRDIEAKDRILYFSREKQNSLINRMGCSSYVKEVLAIPLLSNDELLGVILLQNTKLDSLIELDEEQKRDYVSISELSSTVLGNLIKTNTLFTQYEKTKSARQELNIASNIQQSMLPEVIPEFDAIEVSGFMRPAKEIGGDYFDVIDLKEGNAAIMIGDISGKGLPAGMMMLVIRTIIHTIIRKTNTPYGMVHYLSKVISEYLQSGKFITFIYMFWDNKLGKLKYASCGHEHILIYRDKTKEVERFRSGGIALGILDDLEGFIEEKEIILDKDDVVLLYTDGITEARDETGEFYELDRLQETFGKLCVIEKGFNRLSSEKLKEQLLEDIDTFSKNTVSQYDDMTLVIIRKKGERDER